MTTAALPSTPVVTPEEYKRRIWAWTMYDWANSAFATTILGAVLPVYFSQVAGATLPSPTVATTYWSAGLFWSMLIVAIIGPILGTISDVMRGKKLFLAIFAGVGIASTALLVFVGTGDWILASILAIIGRIGFNGANTFYDSLLPHVAREADQDTVSARGYAMGYLGGGLLLAINVVMIQLIPGNWGARLSFLSVAVWWAIFTIPLLRRVPEPPAAEMALEKGVSVVKASFQRMWETIRNARHYQELFKFLIAFLIYNDGIQTIIGVAVIYGAELGFGSVELVLALLMVQFVAIPYALIFGRLPNPEEKRRPFFLAFLVLNLIALPLGGVLGARLLPADMSGARPAPFPAVGAYVGEGTYTAAAPSIFSGDWQDQRVSADEVGLDQDLLLKTSLQPGAAYEFSFNGQSVKMLYSLGPDYGVWTPTIDGRPLTDPDTLKPVVIDAYNPTVRYEASQTLTAPEPGQHVLRIENNGPRNPDSQGARITLAGLEVLPPVRQSNLGLVIGLIILAELVCLGVAFLLAGPVFSRWAQKIDSRRGILIGLGIYTGIGIWGYFVDSVIEFWFLAWMVAVVQGGSQALSRSLYAALTPAAKSGEFFGLFGIMEKFSSIIGPALFAIAGVLFGSSRPAILSLIILFFVGGYLLTRVNVEAGKHLAQAEDATLLA